MDFSTGKAEDGAGKNLPPDFRMERISETGLLVTSLNLSIGIRLLS